VNAPAATAIPHGPAASLDGKRALVTGGTRGVGAAITGLLAARNAEVAVAARRPGSGISAPRIEADLATATGADHVAARTIEILGGVDIVVHCVGASFPKPGGALGLSDDDWMEALNTNLLAAVRLDRALLPHMLKQRSGAIVHISLRHLRDTREYGHAGLHCHPARGSKDAADHGRSCRRACRG
jgi:NAD(P)-dependent dehydrogenase (short-subunit alcohol dehydrogenase family)